MVARSSHGMMDLDLPLSGIRVLEFCHVAAGPFCGMLLGDMGADVVKVEPPGGDALRQWPPHRLGYSENFASVNRGKRSLILDLKSAPDRATAEELILDADVVVENNRPGAMDRLGLGYAAFSARHPRLVYCSISAYGQTGPRRDQGGFDVTIQAASGLMSVTGERGRTPVKCGVPVSDFAAGLYGAYAVCAALLRVRGGGRGCHIDVPMLGTSLAIAALQTSEYFGTGNDPRPLGSAHPRNAPYQAYQAADRPFVLAAGNDKLWRSVCTIVNRPDLALDPRFTTVAARARNQSELADELNLAFAQRPATMWLAKLEAEGVPASLINTYSEALADKQVEAAGWVVPLTLPNGQDTLTFASPLRLDGATLPIRNAPPELDGNRTEVIAELGLRKRASTPMQRTGRST